MNRLIIILISLTFIFISCNNFQNELKTYNDIIEVELARDTVINEIFMGLNYGDSESTTKKKLRKLLNGKKLSKNENNKIEYEFIIDESALDLIGPIKAIIDVEFHNDKLYEFKLRASLDANTNQFLEEEKKIEFMHLVLNGLFYTKYRSSGYKKIELENILNDKIKDDYYVYSNNQIKISSWLHTDITYTDLRILKEIEIEEEEEKEIKNEANRKERIKQLNDL